MKENFFKTDNYVIQNYKLENCKKINCKFKQNPLCCTFKHNGEPWVSKWMREFEIKLNNDKIKEQGIYFNIYFNKFIFKSKTSKKNTLKGKILIIKTMSHLPMTLKFLKMLLQRMKLLIMIWIKKILHCKKIFFNIISS